MVKDGLASPKIDTPFKHILFVEDDKDFCLLMWKRLEQAGLKCSVAENGLMAQRHLVNNRIDLVITDYHMPIMGGLALIQWMNRNQYKIPIIVLSGEMPKDIQTEIKSPNIVAILTKPYSFSDLYLRIIEVFNTPNFSFSDGVKLHTKLEVPPIAVVSHLRKEGKS